MILLPPGGGPRGVLPPIEDCRSGELRPAFPFVAEAPAGEERKKSGDEEGGLLLFCSLLLLGVDILSVYCRLCWLTGLCEQFDEDGTRQVDAFRVKCNSSRYGLARTSSPFAP